MSANNPFFRDPPTLSTAPAPTTTIHLNVGLSVLTRHNSKRIAIVMATNRLLSLDSKPTTSIYATRIRAFWVHGFGLFV